MTPFRPYPPDWLDEDGEPQMKDIVAVQCSARFSRLATAVCNAVRV